LESEFEETTIERLNALGFGHAHGTEIIRDLREVVQVDRLREFLAARYAPEVAGLAQKAFCAPEGVDPVRRNQDFLHKLTRGVEVAYDATDGERRVVHVYAIDWDDPVANHFQVVNQLTIRGKNDRRPDVIVFVNGLPLVVFELKNPYDENPTVEGAYNQLRHYQEDIPQLFEFNAFAVLSDGHKTLHGVPTAGLEWWAEWKSISGTHIEPGASGSMKTLIEGLFPPERLLSYIRHLVLFESDGERLTKKGAKYHQFFVVRAAAENAVAAFAGRGDNRLGVIWHTQGSGKSLEMVFLAGILRRALNNPLIVIQVDAKALDEQLYQAFVSAKWLVGDVTQAATIKDLRAKLRNEAGQVVFTTLQKFDLLDGETLHPRLSEREDVIVIADEAHRSQYGLVEGMANNIRRALPNAKFLGFTGTPIEFGDASTRAVFGEYIEPIYDIKQAEEDKATVPLYYEARLAPLHLVNPAIDSELAEVLEGQELTAEEARVARWAQMEALAGTKERVEAVARDILDHFDQRTANQQGKAMIVCMSRKNCVALYDALRELRPAWANPDLNKGDLKVVMTSRPDIDPVEWNRAGHVTGSEQRKHLANRLKDPDNPLKVVIVRDMWLTGFDAPVLNTLYVDKPMKGHNLMQAIARVNRVFKDKPGGLIVDYIGIAEFLKEATGRYTGGGGRGAPAPPIDTEAMEQFLERLQDVREVVPEDASGAESLGKIPLEDLVNRLVNGLLLTDEIRDRYLLVEKRLASAASLISHLREAQPYMFEVGVYQRIRARIRKTLPKARVEEIDTAVKSLVDRSVDAEEVVDVFALAGLERADISILDEAFLQEFARKDYPNLRLRLLEKLLKDQIQMLATKNPMVARSFRDMLQSTLDKYHNNTLTSAQVVQAMIQMRKQMEADSAAKTQFGLSDEEVAFYDALVLTGGQLYDQPFLAELVRLIVPSVRENLRPDWTRSPREDVQAGIRAAVKRVLRVKGVKPEDFDLIIARVMEHAQAVYREWPAPLID
jgi:type I restriction enzyme R subunit